MLPPVPLRSSRLALFTFLLLLVVATPFRTAADATTGTVTGSVSLRGNYYYERSTRVVAPAVTGALETPRGVRMDATYLIDAITSASLAAGVNSDILFTEKRHDFQGGVGHEFNFGRSQLDLTVRGRMSREPDYKSRGIGFASALSLNERNSILRFNGYYLHDDVFRIVRMASVDNPTKLMASRAARAGTLDSVSLGFAFDQLLNPTAWLTLGYDLALLNGFTSNPYRRAILSDGGVTPEHHPNERTRHAVYGWFQQYIPQMHASVRAGYRLYRDNWSILAHAVELRYYQELGPYFQTRLRYRYYTQSHAYFWEKNGRSKAELGPNLDGYVTADPKMSPFLDHTVGLQLRLALGFLSHTFLNALRSAVFDGTLEYMRITSRYGPNAWIAQGGFIWPF